MSTLLKIIFQDNYLIRDIIFVIIMYTIHCELFSSKLLFFYKQISTSRFRIQNSSLIVYQCVQSLMVCEVHNTTMKKVGER